MFHKAWDARAAQAKAILASGKNEILRVEKEIDAVLDPIMSASYATIIRRYEDKVEMLEREKTLIAEKLANQSNPPGSFEEKLELALTFLANPWKVWETGCIKARRTTLKLAFQSPIAYCRNEGARTPELSFPFKALTDNSTQRFCYGAVEKTRTSTGFIPQRPQRCASTNSATTAFLFLRTRTYKEFSSM